MAILWTFLHIIFYFRCNENYKGSRCEQYQLSSISANAGEAGLIAAMVIVALLIVVMVTVVIYYICK